MKFNRWGSRLFRIGFTMLMAAATQAGETQGAKGGKLAEEFSQMPAEVRQFIETNLKGCEMISARTELKTNAVLARLMADLYKSRQEFHFELRDVEGEVFKVRLQDDARIERLDECKMRLNDLPDAVRMRLKKQDADVQWEQVCEARKSSPEAVRYELKGRKDGRKIRATLLHDGTIVSYPGMKDERGAENEPASSEANRPFIESNLARSSN